MASAVDPIHMKAPIVLPMLPQTSRSRSQEVEQRASFTK